MRFFLSAAVLCSIVVCGTLQAASILPIIHVDSATMKYFQDYIANFEKTDLANFYSTGKLWIDDETGSKHSNFDAGRQVIEPRESKDVLAGSIHHFTGVMRVPGGTIESIRHVMQDYTRYPYYFRPDVISGTGELMPDSTATDEHYHSRLQINQSTLWVNVGFLTYYDTHYVRLDPNRWVSRSTSSAVKELLNPADANAGTFPEGNDHGLIWKTNTYWFVRQRNGGVEFEANSITVSRPAPAGFGWWGTKRAKEAVDKMLTDLRTAISQK
jgi:hypothetical protein